MYYMYNISDFIVNYFQGKRKRGTLCKESSKKSWTRS